MIIELYEDYLRRNPPQSHESIISEIEFRAQMKDAIRKEKEMIAQRKIKPTDSDRISFTFTVNIRR